MWEVEKKKKRKTFLWIKSTRVSAEIQCPHFLKLLLNPPFMCFPPFMIYAIIGMVNKTLSTYMGPGEGWVRVRLD